MPEPTATRVRTVCLLWALAVLVPAAGGEATGTPFSYAGTGIIEMQAGRRIDNVRLHSPAGVQGSAALVQLNPAVNAWLVLTVQKPGERETAAYHLENPSPSVQQVRLDPGNPGTLVVAAGGVSHPCAFWPHAGLEEARRSKLAYAPFCDGRLFLRNPVVGNRTTLEATTQFLRDHVWHGEEIIGFIRREVFRDAFVERAQPSGTAPPLPRDPPGRAAPPAAKLREPGDAPAVTAAGLGIEREPGNERLVPGRWAAADDLEGVYVSVASPGALAVATTRRAPRGRHLDSIETDALAFLVAFDLARFEIGFALGNEHPRLGWSPRITTGQRDPGRRGPDGIDSAEPLVRLGMLSPALQPWVAATFTGGFKREHGAFRSGALATVNDGSHYGFIEQGVVFSRLVPGLSTVYVLTDGTLGMKTWEASDGPLITRMRHARQNGVALVERDFAGGESVTGPLVDQWGPGNWSGSADEKLRTVRAGVCLVDTDGRRFLVYGYFSSATPGAMSHVFLAYGCVYGMHLDMNALEHTYLALFPRKGSRAAVEHLVQGMSVLDKRVGETVVPRFMGLPDDRDFFYLLSRERGQ